MRIGPPPLLPLLRSQVQGDLLALLYLHPDREYSLSEAAAAIGASAKAVHQEASRLVTAGLLRDRRRGNMRLLRAVTDNLLSRPLTDLLAVTYGPLPVLSDALAQVPGVEEVFIYGSWAARYSGEPGPVPADVDVLVVGSADMDDLEDAARAAQQRLTRPVNIRRVRPEIWRNPDPSDPFLTSVRSHPLVKLNLDARDDTEQVRAIWKKLS
jgi:DNA-binding transcriptional ArsR family regulator